MKRLLVLMAAVAALAAMPRPAEAAAIYELKVTSGGSLLIVDQGVFDSNGLVGQVTYIGIGAFSGWSSVIPTGTGSGFNPLVDLNGVFTNNGSGGPLTIQWTVTDLAGPWPGLVAAIGGTLANGGSLTYEAWYDPGNTLFGMTSAIGSLQSFSGGGAFSGESVGGPVPGGTYSLTQRVIITSGAGSTSFNATVDPVPEPGSMVLFGSGLIGLAAVARRKMRKA